MNTAGKTIPVMGTKIAGSQAAANSPVMSRPKASRLLYRSPIERLLFSRDGDIKVNPNAERSRPWCCWFARGFSLAATEAGQANAVQH
jgi:hypothetical protein